MAEAMAHVFSHSASKAAQILGHTRVDDEMDVERSKEPFAPLPFTSSDIDVSERRLLWKQDLRIVPLWTLVYFLYDLDRSNIRHARLLNSPDDADMTSETGLTTSGYKVAMTVFLIACALFAVPSTLMMKKARPSRWIAFLMFGWGAISMCQSVTTNSGSVAGVQFVLGAFQAGVLPALVYYLTFWYRTEERTLRIALVLGIGTFASSFGGAMAQTIGHLHRQHGISGWRWLFIVEGIPSCVAALVVLFALPDYPEGARWLSEDEKEFAMRRLFIEGSKGYESALTWDDAYDTLLSWQLYGHYLIYWGVSTAFTSLSRWAPYIIAGRGFTGTQGALMAAPPLVLAGAVQIATAWSADRLNARAQHAAVLAALAAVGFLAEAAVPPDEYAARYACLFITTLGTFGALPPLLAWLANNVDGTAAVGLATALNVGLGGALGEITSLWIYKEEEADKGFPTGHWLNAVLMFFVAAGCVILRLQYMESNRRARLEMGVDEVVRLFTY